MKLVFHYGRTFEIFVGSLFGHVLGLQMVKIFGASHADYEIQFEQVSLPQGDLLYVLVFEGVQLNHQAAKRFGGHIKDFVLSSPGQYMLLEGAMNGKRIVWKFYLWTAELVQLSP